MSRLDQVHAVELCRGPVQDGRQDVHGPGICAWHVAEEDGLEAHERVDVQAVGGVEVLRA